MFPKGSHSAYLRMTPQSMFSESFSESIDYNGGLVLRNVVFVLSCYTVVRFDRWIVDTLLTECRKFDCINAKTVDNFAITFFYSIYLERLHPSTGVRESIDSIDFFLFAGHERTRYRYFHSCCGQEFCSFSGNRDRSAPNEISSFCSSLFSTNSYSKIQIILQFASLQLLRETYNIYKTTWIS
jgi:hypothetical protein